jgi:hypothetical protein
MPLADHDSWSDLYGTFQAQSVRKSNVLPVLAAGASHFCTTAIFVLCPLGSFIPCFRLLDIHLL